MSRLHTTEEIKHLYASIGKLITSSLKLTDVLDGIMKEVRTFFSPRNWSLLRLDPATGNLFFSLIQGIDPDSVKNIRLKPGEGIAGIVVKEKRSILVEDTSKDTRFTNKVDRLTGFKTTSIIAVPVIYRDTVFGVIEIINREDGSFFTSDDLLILESIADFAAIAFQNAMTYADVIEKSRIDPLTGVYNKAYLMETIDFITSGSNSLRKSDSRDLQIAILFLDLDDFKEINDTLGHRAGDSTLIEVATELKGCIRQNDDIFRVGGDEFIILMRLDERDDYDVALARVTLSIEKIPDHLTYRCGVSWGAAYGKPGDAAELMEEADKNMYARKRSRKG